MNRNLVGQANVSNRPVRRRRLRAALVRLVLATTLGSAVGLPVGVVHASTANASAESSALCSVFDHIRQLDARATEVVENSSEWKVIRNVTIRLTVKADRQYAIATRLADDRVRADIELQARYARDLRSRLERSPSLREFRAIPRGVEFADAGQAAARLDRYSLRVCGFRVLSPRSQ